MSINNDILISVDERHARNLIAGTKTLELRRRRINVDCGDRVWIYSKVPKGSVEAIGYVSSILSANPTDIWAQYASESGLSSKEFFDYYSGVELGHAIIFSKVVPLKFGIGLSDIRQHHETFQPPQFFQKLSASSPVLQLLREAYA